MKTRHPAIWLVLLATAFSLSQAAAEETAVVKQKHVNVRGQPSLVGEVITQLQQGEKVVVLEEISLSKPKTNEPSKWVRIRMPANVPVWVFSSYIDPAGKTVKVSRINLRAGPGENYSVVGRLERGAEVKEIRKVEAWTEIETPPTAYAFVAANLLSKAEPGTAPVLKTDPPKSAPVPAATEETPAQPEVPKADPAPSPKPESKVAAPPEKASAAAESSAKPPGEAIPPASVDNPPATPSTAAAPEPPSKRIVRREGLVRSSTSIQAPTYYQLLNPLNRKTINYLHADTLEVDLKDYRGRTIIVTGEEAIDSRWPNTPVIEVETLELIP